MKNNKKGNKKNKKAKDEKNKKNVSEDEADQSSDEEENECNCCGITHKRLDDLIAKVGFVVHVVILLMDFYKGKWTWWLNFGSVLCYVSLIYGISRKSWHLYLPYFLVNPFLVIIQTVNMLRISYRGHNLDESAWTAFVNFVTLTLFVLFITAIHVFSILIVLMRFQPFVDYTESKKREKRSAVLAEYAHEQIHEQMSPLKKLQKVINDMTGSHQNLSSTTSTFPIHELDRPPMAYVQRPQSRVKFSPQNSTYYYTPNEAQKPILKLPETQIQQQPISSQPMTRQTKSFIV